MTSCTKSSCPVIRLEEVDGRVLAASTFAVVRVTAVTTCEEFTVSVLLKFRLIASPVCCLADKVRGKGAELITGAAAAPEIVATLPAAQPLVPDVWVQKVTTGLERFTVMLVYEPAGTVADVPRKAESLCNLVRSTLKAAPFSGIFTADPLEGVSVMEVISTMKERRLVLGGGVSGAAVRVKLRVAVLPPQFEVQVVFDPPLHEIRATANNKIGKARILRRFMQSSWPRGCPMRAKAAALQYDIVAGVARMDVRDPVCSTAK